MKPRRWAGPLSVVGTLCLSYPAAAADWRPIDPAHLALAAPLVEKDADAEVLVWDMRVDETTLGSERVVRTEHFVRVKVFTERGRESQARVDLVFGGEKKVTDVAARTVLPDGRVLAVADKDIYPRELVKGRGPRAKQRALSFAFPGVVPGAILDYRWRETVPGLAHQKPIHLQRDIPVQQVALHIRPAFLLDVDQPYRLFIQTFHVETTELTREPDGFYLKTAKNLPAFREEPDMPPELDVRGWLLPYYSDQPKPEPARLWKEHGRSAYKLFDGQMKPNDEITAAAKAATTGATTPTEIVARIDAWCRANIRNLDTERGTAAAEARKQLKDERRPKDTLKARMGREGDIELLAGAMARALGLEVRLGIFGDRRTAVFMPVLANEFFLEDYLVGVKLDKGLSFLSTGDPLLPAGLIDWWHQGMLALLSDPEEPRFVEVAPSAPETSLARRAATLRLAEDGEVEGDIRLEYTGYRAVGLRRTYWDLSETEREDDLKESLLVWLPGAEVSQIRMEGLDTGAQPLVQTCHVKVPTWGQRAGRRLLLPVSAFHRNRPARYTATERRYPVYFDYPWADLDTITYQLPTGFVPETLETPLPIRVGALAQQQGTLTLSPDGTTLSYERRLTFGSNGQVFFPVQSYAGLKQVFEAIQKADGHTVVLSPPARPVTSPPTPTAPSGSGPKVQGQVKETGQ